MSLVETVRAGRGWRIATRTIPLAAVALALATASATAQVAGARAKPFAAWPAPKIDAHMTVAQAKAFVAEHTQPQTKWIGPTTGPKAPREKLTLAWVANPAYTPYIYWGDGVKDAAKALGWKVVTFNGRGTPSGWLAAMDQALALKPAAIITPFDAHALQKPIKEAIARGIPVIGIHAAAYPGPNPQLGLYMNITSNPADIGRSEAAYVIAATNGSAHDIHMVDDTYAIARFKAKATIEPIKNCSGCKLLEEVSVPIATMATRMSSVVSGLLARHGNSWWMTTCCDGYYPYVAAALRASGESPEKVHLVGSDGPPTSYEMIRKGGYEVATVPEPSTLFGYEAVDAAIRAFAGKPPAHFVQPTYIVTKADINAEGGSKNQFIPSNNFACHYKNIWLGTHNPC
ncbi:MAG: substrate-binding domain-containing protein [Acetobacteraceae bacterium]